MEGCTVWDEVNVRELFLLFESERILSIPLVI